MKTESCRMQCVCEVDDFEKEPVMWGQGLLQGMLCT